MVRACNEKTGKNNPSLNQSHDEDEAVQIKQRLR